MITAALSLGLFVWVLVAVVIIGAWISDPHRDEE